MVAGRIVVLSKIFCRKEDKAFEKRVAHTLKNLGDLKKNGLPLKARIKLILLLLNLKNENQCYHNRCHGHGRRRRIA
jgi:hypothetical protein